MLPEPTTLTVFLAAALVLLLTPGPAVLYIVARSIDQGRAAGLVSSLGMGVGTLFHIAAAALGLSALLLSSALAFNVVKYLGAAYLVYLGIRQLTSAKQSPKSLQLQTRTLPRIFMQAVLVNLLNPKTALFFFAFLPQFVDVARGPVAVQIFFLGTLFVLMGLVSDSLYALLAGTAGGWLRRHAGFTQVQRYFAGTVYILLGVATVFSGADNK